MNLKVWVEYFGYNICGGTLSTERDIGMVVVQGYFDGKTIQLSEKIPAKKNQRLIMDEFINETPEEKKGQTARGSLAKYAKPELWDREKTAWEKAVIEKYGDA